MDSNAPRESARAPYFNSPVHTRSDRQHLPLDSNGLGPDDYGYRPPKQQKDAAPYVKSSVDSRSDRQQLHLDSNGLGPDDYGYRPPKQQKDVALQRLKKQVKTLSDANTKLKQENEQVHHELQHYKDRIIRTEESHRLEIQRSRKEVDYHKRLRLGADQRAFEFEDRLTQQRRQTSNFDEAQSSLIEQSQLLVSKNADLAYKVKTLEAQVSQQQELQSCLEEQLDDVLQDRDRLEEELQQVLEQRQLPIGSLTLLEEGEGEEEEEEEDGAEAG